jgi:hypothetical protein
VTEAKRPNQIGETRSGLERFDCRGTAFNGLSWRQVRPQNLRDPLSNKDAERASKPTRKPIEQVGESNRILSGKTTGSSAS